MSNLLSKIEMRALTTDQYIRETVDDKVQIYLHHTASSPNPYAVVRDWNLTPARIGTAFVIAGGGSPTTGETWEDGKIVQTFSSRYWAYHLGLTTAHLRKGGGGAKTSSWLHKKSIGIEICNWGWVKPTNRGFVNWANRVVPDKNILEYSIPYKGQTYYEKYTDAQLSSTRELLIYLCDKYCIPTKFKGIGMFDVTPAALQGESGIWTHTSVRPDKSDCHPQKELIEMLESL